MDITELLKRASEIKNQTKPRANTAVLVGSLFEDIIKTIQAPQLERRIPCVFERKEYSYLNPENMLVYRCLLSNVSKMQISLDERVTWQDIAVDTDGTTDFELPANTVVWFRSERKTIDVIGYATFFGRASIEI